jgi:hypothetical protein
VVIVEAFLAGRGPRFSTDQATDWSVAGRAARREAVGCAVLGFGDSMVKFAVLPRVLERHGAGRAHNLALYDGPPAAGYFLLRRALEAGARPSALVVDFSPHHLARPPGHPDFRRAWPELLTVRECLDLAVTARDPGLFAPVLLARALPSYKARFEVRASLLDALRGESRSPRMVLRVLRRNWQANGGAQALAVNPGYRGEFAPDNPGLFPAPWSCDPASLAYLRRFLALAESRRIRVYWLLPPLAPPVQALRDRLGLADSYARFVRSEQARFPTVTVIDGLRSGYPTSRFADAVHLDRLGASILSADLAALLASPPPGRWQRLPDHRGRPMDVALEDLAQSRAAIRDGR